MNKDAVGPDAATVFIRPSGPNIIPLARLLPVADAADVAIPEILLFDRIQTIGRGRDNTVTIDHAALSRKHARIVPERDGWVIEDLNSTNGVHVNEERIKRAALKSGDSVRIGGLEFRYLADPPTVNQADVPTQIATQGFNKTMYAGHAGVVGALASVKEQQALAETIRERVFASEEEGADDSSAVQRPYRAKFAARCAVVVALAAALVVLGWPQIEAYWEERKLHALVDRFDGQFRRFVEEYEHLPPQQSDHSAELAQLIEHVNAATKQNPGSAALAERRARILFLDFERKLRPLLAEADRTAALALLGAVRQQLALPKSVPAGAGTLAETTGLLALAATLVEFRHFARRFPDPLNVKNAKPEPAELNAMHCHKQRLVKMQRDYHSVLSILYPYFLRMVQDVDESDLRVLNRWTEKLKFTVSGDCSESQP